MSDTFYKVLCTRKLDNNWKDRALREHIILESHDFLTIRLKSPGSLNSNIDQNISPLVFTSIHAVKALAAYDQDFGLKTKDCFCVEGATRAEAGRCGFHVLESDRDSTSLAKTIINFGCKAVFHCSSDDRRPELEQTLLSGGVRYEYCEVYEKAPSPLKFDHADALVFFSPSQVKAFLMGNQLDTSVPTFCIGATTAGYAAECGYKHIHIAPGASTEVLLQTVFQHFNQL